METVIPSMNKKNYILLVVFALLSLSVIAVFVWPYFIEIKRMSKDLVSERDQVASLNMQISELSGFKKEYNNYLPNLKKIESMFVDPQDPIGFIEFIENIAADQEIVLKMSPNLLSQDKQNSIGFQLSGTGNFSNFSGFLKKIEYGPYLINIENLNIVSRKAEIGSLETDVGNLSGEIQASLLIEALSM